MDKKKFKFSIVFCIVAVLCLATLFSAIFVLQNSVTAVAEQISQQTPITNDYIIDESLVLNSSINQNATASLAEGNSTDGISKYCLRDDYVIYTQDQDQNGLCWAFASNMSVATTLMKATGQYYDFSEAWISLAYANYSSSYIYGGGGNFDRYKYVLDNYGLVLESDMQYDTSYIICDQNEAEYYNYYSQFANKDIVRNLNPVTDTYTTNNVELRNKIKSHVYNYGSLELSSFWNSSVETQYDNGITKDSTSQFFYKYPSAKIADDNSAHAISLIGWDDNISFTYKSTTHTGAWLCLNSWGDYSTIGKDGLIYVAYDDTDVYRIAGYTYKKMEATTGLSFQNEVASVKVNDAEYTYTTNLKGKYYTGFSAITNQTKQKNVIFSRSEEITSFEITYNYSLVDKTNGLGVSIDNVSIFKGQEDITSNFFLFKTSLEVSNPHFYIQTNSSLSSGAYKIIVNYSNSDGSLFGSYIDVFYIMDGNEIAKATCYVSEESNITNNGRYPLYNSYNYDSCTINLATTKASGTVHIGYSSATYSESSIVNTNISFSGLSATNTTKQLTKNNIIINLYYITEADLTNYSWVNFYYGTDGGFANNNSRLVVNQTAGVILAEPTKAGYTFAGWYYDKNYTLPLSTNDDGEYVFEYSSDKCQLKNIMPVYDKEGNYLYSVPNLTAKSYYHYYLDGSCMAFLYAKWTETIPEIAINLTSTNLEPVAGEAFTLSVASEPEEAIKSANSNGVTVTINWYKDSALIATTNNSNASSGDFSFLQLEQTITAVGNIDYYVQVIFAQNDLQIPYVSDSVTISAQEPPVDPPSAVDNIDFDRTSGVFSWNAVAEAEGYLVVLYKNIQNSQIIGEFDFGSDTSTYTLDKTLITSAGIYFIGIRAYKLHSTNKVFSTEETYSQNINYYEIKYITFTADKNSTIVQEGTTLDLTGVEPEAKAGYTFVGWCTDENRQTAFVGGSAILGNLTLYANWTMNDISNISAVADIEKEYDKQSESITVSPIHESGLTNFSYVWYKQDQQGQPVVLDGETNSSVSVLNVADSGTYFCQISLIDADGFSVTNNTNDIVVAISKATIYIDTSEVITEYTYNAQEQIISSGAKLLDKNNTVVDGIDLEYTIEDVEYRYTKNSFINVPLSGKFTLTIKALGNSNYKSSQKQIEIKVNKSDSTLKVEKDYQFFRYNGKPIMPEYNIDTTEQTVSANSRPINKGEYDIILTAHESQNYKSATTNVHITVNPANIYIRANDIMGILFAKQQKLTYTIIDGEVYGNDDLGIQLNTNVDTSKLGNYSISITCNNDNYKVAVFEGTYRVTAWPYYVGFFTILFLGWIIISVLKKRRFQYEFETNGGDIVSPVDTKQKNSIVIEEPHKEGYKFVGWYTDLELTKPFKHKYRKSKGITLYAKWEKVDGIRSSSEELKTAQEIVNKIQATINPKKEENQEKNDIVVSNDTKEQTEQEKMKDIVDSIKTKGNNDYSKEELEKFINRIIDND